MISIRKNLILASLGFIANQVEATNIHNSCLKLTNTVEGNESGEFFTNEAQLTTSDFDDQLRLHSFTTCYEDEKVLGLQFFLSLDPLTDSNNEIIPLEPIGQMIGTCDTIKPTGHLEKIRVSGGDEGVNGIRFYTPNDEITYGSVSNYSWKGHTWEFKETAPLMGIYGRQSENGIEQIGFIKIKMNCQAEIEEFGAELEDLEETVDVPVDETVSEPVDGETVVDGEVNEEPIQENGTVVPEEHTELELVSSEVIEKKESTTEAQMDYTNFIIIGVAIVIFAGLLITSIKLVQHKKSKGISLTPGPAVTSAIIQTAQRVSIKKKDNQQRVSLSKANQIMAERDIEYQKPHSSAFDSQVPAIAETDNY